MKKNVTTKEYEVLEILELPKKNNKYDFEVWELEISYRDFGMLEYKKLYSTSEEEALDVEVGTVFLEITETLL